MSKENLTKIISFLSICVLKVGYGRKYTYILPFYSLKTEKPLKLHLNLTAFFLLFCLVPFFSKHNYFLCLTPPKMTDRWRLLQDQKDVWLFFGHSIKPIQDWCVQCHDVVDMFQFNLSFFRVREKKRKKLILLTVDDWIFPSLQS